MANLNPISRVQKWMDSLAGQTFMNYAYSWGAAVVILGTLFKLLHLSGANVMLLVGMGTEVFVFFISGFERVTDRLPEDEAEKSQGQGNVYGSAPVVNVSPVTVENPVQPAVTVGIGQIRAANPVGVEEALSNYTQELNELAEVLSRVKEQAAHMGSNGEEMEDLNRMLTGMTSMYELQLRNISRQVSTIEQIDEQTRRMAQQIEELNNVYARMIKALTVNMQPMAATSAE
ncbi:MAG: gliding motility protein GldL [Bacteroidaceae bacterium]|nr:gliding motility protein GldL [Bacteroidaceae bacterium]